MMRLDECVLSDVLPLDSSSVHEEEDANEDDEQPCVAEELCCQNGKPTTSATGNVNLTPLTSNRGALATDARGCSLWRYLLERPPPAPESRVRDPLRRVVAMWTRGSYIGAVTRMGVRFRGVNVTDVYARGVNVTLLISTGRRRREPANIQNTFSNQINKQQNSGSPSRTTAANKTQTKIQAWSSLVFHCCHSSFYSFRSSSVGLETGEWRRCRSLSFTPPASLRSHGSRPRPTRHSVSQVGLGTGQVRASILSLCRPLLCTDWCLSIKHRHLSTALRQTSQVSLSSHYANIWIYLRLLLRHLPI